jgi:hypothetical protein
MKAREERFPEFAENGNRSSTGFTGAHRGVETSPEDLPCSSRPGGMLFKLTLAAIVLIALAGAIADLSRGRRPRLVG